MSTTMKRDGGAAFPVPGYSDGMTLRDWFAGQALAGWLASFTDETTESYEGKPEAFAGHMRAVAQTCYGYADAMLAAREEVAS